MITPDSLLSRREESPLIVEIRPLVWIPPVEKRARFVANEFDERRDPQCLSDVLHIHNENRDAQEDEDERRQRPRCLARYPFRLR